MDLIDTIFYLAIFLLVGAIVLTLYSIVVDKFNDQCYKELAKDLCKEYNGSYFASGHDTFTCVEVNRDTRVLENYKRFYFIEEDKLQCEGESLR